MVDITERKKLENALRQSEERYRRITESLADYIYSVRIENGVPVETVHGPACVAVTGYTSEEFASNPYLWMQMVHEEDRLHVEKQVSEIYSEKRGELLEHRIVRKDGALRWIRNTPILHFDERGELISYDGLIQDITEFKKKEEELKESEMRFRTLFNDARDGILLADLDTKRFSMCNKAICRMLGYTEEEIKALGVKDIHPEQELPYVIEQFEKQMREEIKLAPSLPVRKRDGSIFYADIVSSLVTIAGKTYLMGSFRDITERKKAEKEIREARDFLENVFKTTADGIIVNDSRGFITMANDAASKILGYSHDEILGMHSAEFGSAGDLHEKGKALVTRLLENGVVIGEEHTWVRKDGSLIDIEINAALLQDSEGNLTGSVANIRDITERKKAEEALKKSEKRHHNLIEFANIGIIAAEHDKITHVNRRAEEIYGYSREELIGKSPGILTPEKYRKKHREILNEFLTFGEVSKIVFEE
jgi:PAS domain S-box-containing protein